MDVPASAERMTLETPPAGGTRQPLISNGSTQHKIVRFGTLEPAHMTLAKQSLLPCVVILCLLTSMLAWGQKLTPEFFALGLVAFLISAQIFSPLDLRRVASAGRFRRLPVRVLLEWSCVVAVLVFLSVSFRLMDVFSRDALVSWFAMTPAALWMTETLAVPVMKRLVRDRHLVTRFIIIGANDVGLELARRMEESESLGRFYGFFDYRHAERLGAVAGAVNSSCKAADFANFVRQNGIDRVYIALPMSTAPRIHELLDALRDTTASVYFVPNLFAFDLVQARCIEINGMPAFSICDSPLQGMSAIWKRVLDLALAAAALALLWPVFVVIALLIKFTSPGPVLFKQRRYGLNGEEILIYKFRSMTVWEDGPVIAQATKEDRRLTRVGKFLRRTSLDELPQIFNVLEGKMSFVGPRPHAVAHNEEYRKLISGYMIRHKVRPGITGWAQVNGLRGETSTVEKMHERVQFDLDYLKNWSLRFDLRIIARTARILLSDRNAY
jgi:putative colanic acid biosynthesis UDP-glucose lipid carrier transferase